MESKMRHKRTNKKKYIHGIWLVLFLVITTSGCGGSKTASEDMLGTWKPTNIQYAGTSFKIEKKAITFHTKEGDSNSYAIKKVKKEQLQDPEWLQVTIFYNENNSQKVEFPFYFQKKDNGLIRFKNQPDLIWKNMNSKTNDPHNKNAESFLFVCSQNASLSPMAEGLAKKLLGKNTRIESAGLTSTTNGASYEAIWVLMDMYNIDISHHKTRKVADFQIDSFDRVVVLEASVLEALKTRHPSISDRITLWDIENPEGKGREIFRNTAAIIKKTIERNLLSLYNN
jgi:protein-tyrosine phosphatase